MLPSVVVAVQEQLLVAFGGAGGLRDPELLDSALARPQHLLSHERATANLFRLAASYAFGFAKNHPFVDGNKRIAFATASMFVELNGYRFQATEADVVRRTLAPAPGDLPRALR